MSGWFFSWRTCSFACIELLFLHTTSPVEFTAVVSQDFSICFQPTVVQVSVLCLRRTDILNTLGLTLRYHLSCCRGSTRKGKSLCPYHTHNFVHITHPAVWWLQKTYLFHMKSIISIINNFTCACFPLRSSFVLLRLKIMTTWDGRALDDKTVANKNRTPW